MSNKTSNVAVNSDLNNSVEDLIAKLRAIKNAPIRLRNGNDLEKLETRVHAIATELADKISGIKLQESMDEEASKEEEKKSD